MSRRCRHRCCPDKIADLQLTPNQKTFLTDIGFGCFNDILSCKLCAELTTWLVRQVNCASKTLVLGNKAIPIEPLVPKLLGIPKGTMEVQKSSWKCSKALKQRYTEHAYYLSPNTTLQVNRDFLDSLEDVDKIKEFNWCAFVVQYLISRIENFTNLKSEYVYGCVHILHLIYFDFLHKSEICQTPRIQYVRGEDLHDLQPLDLSSKVLNFSETLYAEELSGYAEEVANVVYAEEVTNADGTSNAWKIFEDFAKESNSTLSQLVDQQMLVTKQMSDALKASEDWSCKLKDFSVTFNAKLHSIAQVLKNGTNKTLDKSDMGDDSRVDKQQVTPT
ncbi:uncharacterized protein LOC120683416 isoform X2 [Panicum virgatum]|uniref:uncharacterized protein LOC120683416 isoform X2 n=1 Tax=Panicum virgatum TaxID=38727 RepID=UPI0019D5AADE|nr:uncharacterized protein LOC120683416 isoform X2 [Panicum virgatum]